MALNLPNPNQDRLRRRMSRLEGIQTQLRQRRQRQQKADLRNLPLRERLTEGVLGLVVPGSQAGRVKSQRDERLAQRNDQFLFPRPSFLRAEEEKKRQRKETEAEEPQIQLDPVSLAFKATFDQLSGGVQSLNQMLSNFLGLKKKI